MTIKKKIARCRRAEVEKNLHEFKSIQGSVRHKGRWENDTMSKVRRGARKQGSKRWMYGVKRHRAEKRATRAHEMRGEKHDRAAKQVTFKIRIIILAMKKGRKKGQHKLR